MESGIVFVADFLELYPRNQVKTSSPQYDEFNKWISHILFKSIRYWGIESVLKFLFFFRIPHEDNLIILLEFFVWNWSEFETINELDIVLEGLDDLLKVGCQFKGCFLAFCDAVFEFFDVLVLEILIKGFLGEVDQGVDDRDDGVDVMGLR